MKKNIYIFLQSYLSPGIAVIINHFRQSLIKKGYDMTVSSEVPLLDSVDKQIIIPYGPKEAYILCKKKIPVKISFMVDYYSLGCLHWAKHLLKNGAILNKFVFRKILQALLNQYREYVVLKHIDNVMFVSQSDIDKMKIRFPNVNYYCLPNGVECPPYKPLKYKEGGNLRLGILCHWTEDSLNENMWFISKVFPKLKKRYPNIELVIGGKGATKKMINYFLNIDGVDFIGEFGELHEFFDSIDIYAATTLRGCGIMNKVLDAFAYSKPVIGTSESFSGFSSLKDGYLICKTAEEFSKVLDLYLSGNSVFQTNVKNAYEYIEKYHNWNRNYVEFVDKLFQDKILK